MKSKKFCFCNQKRDRDKKLDIPSFPLYDIPLSTGGEKSPMSYYSALLPLILIIFFRAGYITRKCEEPQAAVAFFKKLEIELHCKLDFNKMNSQNLKKYLKIATQ